MLNIAIVPNPSLVDEPVHIRLTGLKPGLPITIRASRTAQTPTHTIHLGSHGEYLADSNGVVDLARQPSLDGTFAGLEPMGLFWSLKMLRTEARDNGHAAGQVLQPQLFSLQVESSGQVVGSASITRLWTANDVSRIPVRENGLVATLFCSKDGTPRPGVIVAGGSEGGLNEPIAALLASHGFSTLSLAYFGIEPLPKRAAEIPLEYVESAIEWMQYRNEVTPGWLGIHGTSKGSELALLAGSLFEKIKAVVSLSGSAISFAGIVPWSADPFLPPSWTYKGLPIPYATPENPVEIALKCKRMQMNGEGGPLNLWYRHLSSDADIVDQATIPVERIRGPALFITGADDGDIPRFSKIGMDRLGKFGHPYEFSHLNLPGGTHAIGIPYVRVTIPGKDMKAVADASRQSWVETKQFFMRSFRNGEIQP
jgi:pimeloyl-ACP methyl ester carboxylesterase